MIAMASERIGLWDVNTHQLIHELISPYADLHCYTQRVSFSGDSTLLAVSNYCTDSDWTGHILVWDTKSGNLLFNREQKFSKNTSKWPNSFNNNPAPGFAFLPTSSVLAFANGNAIEITDVRQNNEPVELQLGDKMFATDISISGDGRKLFAFMDFDSDTNVESVTAKSYAVQIWNLQTNARLRYMEFPPSSGCCGYFYHTMSLFGHLLAYVDNLTGSSYITNLENGNVKKLPYRKLQQGGAIFLTSDGDLEVFLPEPPVTANDLQYGPGCENQTIELWNTNTWQNIYTFQPSGASFYLDCCFGSIQFAVSPDHKVLAIGHDEFLNLWDISNLPGSASN
jgi:WD40 repeat protein